MRFFTDLYRVFYPRTCVCCSQPLVTAENVLCNYCSNDLPILQIKNYKNNIITKGFFGRLTIESAASFMLFTKKNNAQELIHHLKYKKRQDIGSYLGNWFATLLKETNFSTEADYLIPVPIHSKKLKQRGYNQVSTFCECLSNSLSIPIETNVLLRKQQQSSQTSRNRYDRLKKIQSDFMLNNSNELNNKHIILVDDVITTGATIEACCLELLKIPNIKISVLSMAFTENS